ncbi:MAG: hypothetical protein RR275_04875 [Lachnospiraceae bacterium]
MKNLKYFPFERNKYFYGKLLSVDDFETEQKYFNDKRRMLNRYLFGTGIVCGLRTVLLDDRTISIERGIALDFAGREIVVDTPIIAELSSLEGFQQNQLETDGGYYYLCLEYDEQEIEKVHNVTNHQMKPSETLENNKFKETYKVFLTNAEPVEEIDDLYYCSRDIKTVYWGNGIRIKQEVPKFIKANEELMLTITIENMGQPQPFSFQYQAEGTCIKCDYSSEFEIKFNSETKENTSSYQLNIPLQTMDVKADFGEIKVMNDSFILKIGNQVVKADAIGVHQKIGIVKGEVGQAIEQEYHETAMEEISKKNYQQSIYLAKFSVIHAGSSYVIDHIDTVPFNQYIYNHELLTATLKQDEKEIQHLKEINEKQLLHMNKICTNDTDVKQYEKITSGYIVFDLGLGGNTGQKYFSEEIAHGLGLGNVSITLGMCDSMEKDTTVLYGDHEIFENEKKCCNAKMAAKLQSGKGTFVIGLQLNAPSEERFVKIYWTAVKKIQEKTEERGVKKIRIKPDMPSLEVGKSIYFEAVLEGFQDDRLNWKLKENEMGMMNQKGMYTAPNVPGVYEISVESMNYPELKSSTFIMVRDAKK